MNRLVKNVENGVTVYEVRHAAVQNSVFHEDEFEGCRFRVTAGDYQELLQKVGCKSDLFVICILWLVVDMDGEHLQHTHIHLYSMVGIRNLSPQLRNIADNQIDCGTAIADLQNLTSSIPQLSTVSCQSATRYFLVSFPQLRMVLKINQKYF
jgi:hypothetical protein